MKFVLYYILTLFFLMLCASCETNNQKEQQTNHKLTEQPTNAMIHQNLTVGKNQEESLKLIKDNFQKINNIKTWSKTDTIELEETTEGGIAEYYHHNGKLQKIITRNYGEMFQQITEYYLLDENLSFVFDKMYYYNRPISYDEEAMKENGDTETFDLEKSTIIESRNYFENNKLLQIISNGEDLSATDTTEIENNIKSNYKKLIEFKKINSLNK